jgi:hypothetical protein
MQRLTHILAMMLIAAGGIFAAGLGHAAGAQDTTGAEAQIVVFDVAENGARLVFDPAFADDNGLALRGATYVTEGYIYPAGTLTDSNGVLEDGSPEFPDKVIGTWIGRGWVTQDVATATTGPFLASQHLYTFGTGEDAFTFVSNGEELIDPGVAITRPVTGGSGPLSSAGGQIHQTLLGFNASQGLNLHFEAELTFVETGVDINTLLTPIPMAGTPEATPTG